MPTVKKAEIDLAKKGLSLLNSLIMDLCKKGDQESIDTAKRLREVRICLCVDADALLTYRLGDMDAESYHVTCAMSDAGVINRYEGKL